MPKHIFTFWEPKNELPAYLKLCLQTWKKFIPAYKIIFLDYQNIFDWIPKDTLHPILFSKIFSKPMQADTLRCALLYHHGGVWFDVDTIITSEKIYEILDRPGEDVIMIGDVKKKSPHLAFIQAKKHAPLLERWLRAQQKRVLSFARFKRWRILQWIKNPLSYKKRMRKFQEWNILGNSILDGLANEMGSKAISILDRLELFATPENNMYDSDPYSNYQKFYFGQEDFSHYVLEKSRGIIVLHNSWMPDEYKMLSSKAFLQTHCTLAKILEHLLQPTLEVL